MESDEGLQLKICIVQNVSLTNHMALSTYLRNLINSLASTRKVSVTALVSESYPGTHKSRDFEIMESGTDLYSISGNLKFILWVIMALRRIGKREHIDVIHCLYPFSSTIACLIYKYLFSSRTQVVYDIRSPWIDMSLKRGKIKSWLKGIYRIAAIFLEAIIVMLIDSTIFITEGLFMHYKAMGLFLPSKILISPSGVDTIRFHHIEGHELRIKLGLDKSVQIIGYVGGVAKTRQLGFILDGFRKLQSINGRKWALVFIGDGDDLRNLETYSLDNGITDVYFLGQIPYDYIASLISDMKCGICHLPDTPIFNTSFPMKILEYLACGIPVVMSNMPAHTELARKLPGTYIYDYTPESFAETIAINSDSNLVNQSSIERYSWSAITNHLIKFYRAIS